MRKGTHHSEETRNRISHTKAGQPHTEEHSNAISTALKGRTKTEEHKKAIAAGIRAAYARKQALKEATAAATPVQETNVTNG